MQLKREAKLLTVIGLTTMHSVCHTTFMLYLIFLYRRMILRNWVLCIRVTNFFLLFAGNLSLSDKVVHKIADGVRFVIFYLDSGFLIRIRVTSSGSLFIHNSWGYYGFTLVSVCPSVCILFPDDNLCKCQWIFIKLSVH